MNAMAAMELGAPPQQLGPYQMVSEPSPSTAISSSSIASEGAASLKIFLEEFRADLSFIFSSIRHDLSSINSSLDRCIDHAKGPRSTILSSSGSIDVHEPAVITELDSWVKIPQEPQSKGVQALENPNSMIGSQSLVLPGAAVEENVILGALSVALSGAILQRGGVHLGSPPPAMVKHTRLVSDESIEDMEPEYRKIVGNLTANLAATTMKVKSTSFHRIGAEDVLREETRSFKNPNSTVCSEVKDVCSQTQAIRELFGITRPLSITNIYSHLSDPHHNGPDVLGATLLQLDRFDRQETVDRPDVASRVQTSQVHSRCIVAGHGKKNEAAPGVNEVAPGVKKILVAYFEAGHDLLGTLMPTKISILPRGQAGVLTMFAPSEERQESDLYRSNNLDNQMASDMKHVIPLRPPPKPPPATACLPSVQGNAHKSSTFSFHIVVFDGGTCRPWGQGL